jgi:hypothetical protein
MWRKYDQRCGLGERLDFRCKGRKTLNQSIIGDDFVSLELAIGIQGQIAMRESDTQQIDVPTKILAWPCG